MLRTRRQLPSGGMEEWHEVVAARGRLWQRLINDLPPDSHSDRVRARAEMEVLSLNHVGADIDFGLGRRPTRTVFVCDHGLDLSEVSYCGSTVIVIIGIVIISRQLYTCGLWGELLPLLGGGPCVCLPTAIALSSTAHNWYRWGQDSSLNRTLPRKRSTRVNNRTQHTMTA